MRRTPLIAIVAALALGAGMGDAGADPPTGADHETEVGVGFHFRAGGFVFRLGNNPDDVQNELTVVVGRRGQSVYYLVDGQVTESGIEAKLGKLGEISLAFEPTETRTGHLPPRCQGEPGRLTKGIYTGTFRFRGERGYVEVERDRIPGQMHITPWHYCPLPKGIRRPAATARRAARDGEDLAVLGAGARRRDTSVGFGAIASRRPGESSTTFIATTLETEEGLRIAHYAVAGARASTFRFDLGEGTATVRPPWPFQGAASFRRGPHAHNSWSGSLRVQMLGIGPVDLVAPGFRAKITNEYNDE